MPIEDKNKQGLKQLRNRYRKQDKKDMAFLVSIILSNYEHINQIELENYNLKQKLKTIKQ